MISPLVILDRDGVINFDSDTYIKSPGEWQPIPGSIEAIAALYKAGYTVVVATNQSGIGRGLFDEYALAMMHEKLHALVEDAGGQIAGIFLCPHTPDAGCHCRKPATGMLDQIEQEFDRPVRGAWFIGDSEKDLDCALARNCQPILVLTGKGQATLDSLDDEKKGVTRIVADLAAAARFILEQEPESP
jgi:D-glycero-D-manno-heptose 1,7-bisphosphate phosphatase